MNPQADDILEGLRPRMRTARVAHVRRLMAGIAMVPLIGFGAVAMAAGPAEEPSIETAESPDREGDERQTVDLPDIGEADEDTASEDVAEKDSTETHSDSEADVAEDEKAEPADETKVLSLGPLGEAKVLDSDGELELLDTDLESGWEVVNVEVGDDGIIVIIKKGDSIKIVTISNGVRGEVDVKVTDFFFPTTTTAPPTTTTEKHVEQPPVVDRFVVEVPGKGSFVVEREGETLWVGNVEANEGYDYEIQQGEGWKVWVKFTNGEWNWYGKALINDHGEVEQHFWDEEPPFEPIHQWVEVPGVGAVKFSLSGDGLVTVKNWETAEGFGFWDYNQGEPAEIGKIDFEGEGVLWIVEAWRNEEGGLSWSTTDATAPAPAE